MIPEIRGSITVENEINGSILENAMRGYSPYELAARGMDIQEIQKLLGHSNLNTTMKYIKVNDAQVQASYRRFIA